MNEIMINQERLFGQGEHELIVEEWQRDVCDYGFAGLSGTMRIDMGQRQRRLLQRGQLKHESSRGLRNRIARINQLCNGKTYTLRDPAGQLFENVLIERFRLTSSIHHSGQAWCDYEIEYIQLGE